jgi:hypothetical protein
MHSILAARSSLCRPLVLSGGIHQELSHSVASHRPIHITVTANFTCRTFLENVPQLIKINCFKKYESLLAFSQMPDIEACPEPVQSTPNWIIIIIIDDDYDEHIKQYEMDLACSMHG